MKVGYCNDIPVIQAIVTQALEDNSVDDLKEPMHKRCIELSKDYFTHSHSNIERYVFSSTI